MPTYVYECSSCQTTFEAEQRITAEPLDACGCGSAGTVKRIIQPVGVMFKGSGFYVNDSKPASSEETPMTSAADCTGTPATCACSTDTKSD